jgi:hypothetical protein
MKKDKLIFLSADCPMAEVNFIKYFTKVTLEEQNALKIISCYESLKQDLEKLCHSKIGISPFTRDETELNIVGPLIEGYHEAMQRLDPEWWAQASDSYILSLMDALPPAVKFIATECNEKVLLNSPLRLDSVLVRITGLKGECNPLAYLSQEQFKAQSQKNADYSLNITSSISVESDEDICDKSLKAVRNLINSLNDS